MVGIPFPLEQQPTAVFGGLGSALWKSPEPNYFFCRLKLAFGQNLDVKLAFL